MDFQRMFDDAKRQGAERIQWQQLDDFMKGYLVRKTAQRLDIERTLNDAHKAIAFCAKIARFAEQAQRISAEIEQINEVRRAIAAELATLNA